MEFRFWSSQRLSKNMTQSTPCWGTGMHTATSDLTSGEWVAWCGSEGSEREHVSVRPVLGCWHASGGSQTSVDPAVGDVAAVSGGMVSGDVALVVVCVALGGR